MNKDIDIPSGWSMKSISKLGEVVGGGTPSTQQPLNFGGDIPWLTPKDLSGYNYVYIKGGERNITQLGLKNSSARLLPKDTVLFTSRAPVGYVAIAENEMSTNQGFKSVIGNSDVVDSKFLYYLLKFNKEKIESVASGSTFKEISGSALKEFRVTLPNSLDEQRKISNILFSIDRKIELNHRMNKTLEKISQAIFKKWFMDFEFPGYEKVKFIDEIPPGWKMGKMSDLVQILSGFAFKSGDFVKEGRYRLATIKNVQDGYFDRVTKDGLSALPEKMPEYCKLRNGDILLSLTGNVGRVCFVEGDNYLLNQRVAKLAPINKIDTAFIYLLFRQRNILVTLENLASGTAQQNLSPVKTAGIDTVIPDRNIMERFGKIVNPIFEKLLWNLNQNIFLVEIRDSLLPRLMTGKVRVNYE